MFYSKVTKLIGLLLLCNTLSKAQNPIVIYDTKYNSSISIQGVKLYDIQSKKYFFQYTSTGASVFNIKTRLLQIDAQTFKEVGRMDWPEFKGYEKQELNTKDDFQALKGYGAFFMSKKDPKTRKKELYFSKVLESFSVSPQPEKLFTIRTSMPWYYLTLTTNDDKSVILITENLDDNAGIIHRVYDKDLNFKMSDSVTAKTNGGDTVNTIMLNNGFAIVAHNTLGRHVKILDVVDNKVIKFSIKNTKKVPMIKNLKKINNTIVLCGTYSSRVSKKVVSNGVFKYVYDLDKNSLVEEYYYDHVPQGKSEAEAVEKIVYSSCITPNGFCYQLICQMPTGTAPHKFELMGLGNNSDKFRKQIPSHRMDEKMLSVNNTIFIGSTICEKYDVNNFVYENPLIIKQNLYALDTDLRSVYLKVGPNGYIETHPKQWNAEGTKKNWIKIEDFTGGHEIKDIDYSKVTLTE